MVFSLQPESAVPRYLRIVEGLRHEISVGLLAAGTRLPSSRQLARDLGVSRITVANAYAELEADGLIEARVGSGTFVLPPRRLEVSTATSSDGQEIPVWQERFRGRPVGARERMLGQALRSMGPKDTMSFAWGAGDMRLFPADQFRRILADVLHSERGLALGPESPQGFPGLRQSLARYLRQQGIDVDAADVLITAGTQQAINLVARTLLQPGDRVVVEAPTWPGALDVFEGMGVQVIGIPLDAEGMCIDALACVLEREQPRLIFAIPTFQNPTGSAMSVTRRQELVGLSHRHGVPILEDDNMRELRFGSPVPPPLAAFDRHGDVIYAASFTKSLIPALRLGYLIARGPVREVLVAQRRALDMFSSTLLQRALYRYLESGDIHAHWKHTRRVYRRRHAAMIGALQRHFPPGAAWRGVEGGFVSWVEVPASIPIMDLLEDAVREGVGFAPGAAFFPQPAEQPFMRLNFAALNEWQIEEGVAVLGGLLRRHLSH
jgi:GntR family transcriptional regulator / MocR family aminotransferase